VRYIETCKIHSFFFYNSSSHLCCFLKHLYRDSRINKDLGSQKMFEPWYFLNDKWLNFPITGLKFRTLKYVEILYELREYSNNFSNYHYDNWLFQISDIVMHIRISKCAISKKKIVFPWNLGCTYACAIISMSKNFTLFTEISVSYATYLNLQCEILILPLINPYQFPLKKIIIVSIF